VRNIRLCFVLVVLSELMGVITRGNQRGRKRLAWVMELVVIFRVIGTLLEK
jgi:hypothetical protein